MRCLMAIFFGLAAVAPIEAATVQEDFAQDPVSRGWRVFGEASLFHWNAANQNLEVTWDSSRTNSYFYLPLGTILAKDDDFEVAFDLLLNDIAAGTTPGKPSTFQIAVALFDFAAAARSNFYIGSGVNPSTGPRSTVEFNYFPAMDFDATFAAIAVSSNATPFLFSHDFPLALDLGVWHRITLSYTASNQTLAMTKTRAGVPYGATNIIRLGTNFIDFRLNALALASYSDAGQSPPEYAGSVLAHGSVDNVLLNLPEPPVRNMTGSFTDDSWQIQFTSRTNWLYTLERTADFQSWKAVSPPTSGTGGVVMIDDTNTPAVNAFYRVRSARP